ncbi:MAG: hypothetical protein QME96_02605 [Myxococcota bacterium]|nr:hypothetical protein [Myxococcota bacterium]
MRRKFVFVGTVALACTAAAGCRRSPAAVPQVCGDVIDEAGLAVSGAVVRVDPGGMAIAVDGEGRFCVGAGAAGVVVSAEAAGFCTAEPIRAPAGGWARIRLQRRLFVVSWHQVGYGMPVELRAEMRCPPPGPVAFMWEQIDGEPLLGRAESSDSAVLAFRTPPLAVRSRRPDILSISPAQAGRYGFRVTARAEGGWTAEADATVTAASVQPGVVGVGTGTDVHIDPGTALPDGVWRLVSQPPGSQAAFRPVPTTDGAAGVVRLRPDLPGPYEVLEVRSRTRMVIEAYAWDVVLRDCHRPDCHPGEQAGWALTAHARALDARLGAPEPHRFGGECLSCHVVGWDPGARNGGFDDVAAALRVDVRAGFPGGGAALPRDLRRLANVWCGVCHGPARLPAHDKRPMVVRAGVCATCHDMPPRYRHVAEWRTSRMSVHVADEALLDPPCSGCHTAQGAIAKMRGRIVSAVDPSPAEPVTCAVCHVLHSGAPAMLRRIGTTATVSGAVQEAGRGAVCIDCHQAGHRADGATEAERFAPMASQAEILLGKGAFGFDGTPAHLPPNLCVDCHMAAGIERAGGGSFGGHTFRAAPSPSLAPSDCDGDGIAGPLAAEMQACLALADAAVSGALATLPGCAGTRIGVVGRKLAPLGADGVAVAACESAWSALEQAAIYRAAYDLMLVRRDGRGGGHNPAFAIELLRRIIAGGGRLPRPSGGHGAH